jgi:hypothetical protein
VPEHLARSTAVVVAGMRMLSMIHRLDLNRGEIMHDEPVQLRPVPEHRASTRDVDLKVGLKDLLQMHRLGAFWMLSDIVSHSMGQMRPAGRAENISVEMRLSPDGAMLFGRQSDSKQDVTGGSLAITLADPSTWSC